MPAKIVINNATTKIGQHWRIEAVIAAVFETLALSTVMKTEAVPSIIFTYW